MKFFNKILSSKLGKSILIIAGGTAFAQVLGIIFSPIITRIYPPQEYGVLTTYTAVLSLLFISASLDYQKAIPIAKDNIEAISLLILSILLLSVFTVFLVIILYLFGEDFLKLMKSETLLQYKYLIPIGVFFSGLYSILLQWGYRERNYRIITRTTINQSLLSNILKVGLGLLKIGPIGLIIGTIIGQSGGVTSLTLPIIKSRENWKQISFKNISYVFKRYKNFMIFSAPSNYVYNASNSVPVLFFTILFGGAATGFFGLSRNIIYLPVTVIGNSMSQVVYSEAAYIGMSNPLKIKNTAIQLMKKVSIIALFPSVILLIFGPFLFDLVFGPHWYDAGVYARIMSIMVYTHFLMSPVSRLLEVFEYQNISLFLNILRLLLVVISFVISYLLNLNEYTSLFFYSLSNAIVNILLIVIVFKILNRKIKQF